MRYRVKIRTYQNGRKEYVPQVKKLIWWLGLTIEGKTEAIDLPRETMEMALACIDRHYKGNGTIQKVEFKYVYYPKL